MYTAFCSKCDLSLHCPGGMPFAVSQRNIAYLTMKIVTVPVIRTSLKKNYSTLLLEVMCSLDYQVNSVKEGLKGEKIQLLKVLRISFSLMHYS